MANPFAGLFDEAAKQHGLEPDWLSTFARIESGFNPNVRTGSYKGLFQLSDDEFGKHGGQGNIFDPRANTFAAAAKLRRERDEFASKYGRQPTAAEIYFIHQQGVAGAPAHWNNPNQPAWQSMLSTPEGQRKGAGWARQAIWGNVPNDVKAKYGSVDNLPSGEFWKLWQDKVARFGGQSVPQAPQPPDGMDASTYGAPKPSPAPMMALGGPRMNPMPYDGPSPEQIALQRRLALQQMEEGSDTSPVAHPLQALARALKGGLGGYGMTQAGLGERQGQQAASQALISALQGGDPKSAIAGMAGNPWTRDLAGKLAAGALQGELEAQSPMGRLKHRALQLDVAGKEELAPLERDARREELESKKAQRQLDQWIFGQMQGGAPAGTVSPGAVPASPISPVPGVSVAPPTGAVTPGPATSPQGLRDILASRSPADRMAFLLAYRKDPAKAAEMLKEWGDPNKKFDEATQKEAGEAKGKAQAALPGITSATDSLLRKIDDVMYEPDPKNPGKYMPDPKRPGQLKPNQTLPQVIGPFDGSSWVPTLRGSSVDMQERIKQLGGAAFLQAFEALKGGGAIQEKEGEKATAALARLANLRQSEPGYREALKEFRDEVVRLRQLAFDRAAGKVPMPSAAPSPEAAAAVPPQPPAVPPGSQYSPSRKQWKSPDGQLFDETGKPVR